MHTAFFQVTPERYDYYCGLLNGPFDSFDSVTYGLNERSPLNSINDFHVANGQLPQDIMHVIYEGVLPLNLRLLLKKLVCDEHRLTIDTLNERMKSFSYGRNESRNKPSKFIEKGHLIGTRKLPFSGI